MSKFLKRLPAKLWMIVCAAVTLAFFANDIGLVDLQKTALVLAAGIDRDGEEFSLTAQIAVPKGTDRTTGGTSSVEIEGRGATIPECLSDIYARTGWVPKLVFCDLLVLGETATRGDVFDCLDYFLRNEYIPDACLLAACAGSAKELISSASAIDDTSALALLNLFSEAAQKSGQVVPCTLREFAIGYFGESRSGYMPYVRAQAQEGSEQGAGGQGAAQNAEQGQQAQKVYSARETALFSGGALTGVLMPEETFAFSLLLEKVYAGAVTADDKTYVILKNKGGAELVSGGVPGLALRVECKVQIAGEHRTVPPDELAAGELSEEEEVRLSQTLEEHIRSLWQACSEADCDLFFFRRSLRRASRELFAKWKELPLSELDVRVHARAKSLR